MHARFALLNVMIRAGEGFCELETKGDSVEVKMDRSKIETVGKKAVGDFLMKLNVLKATADVKAGEELFGDMTKVDDGWLKTRDIVLANKKPRPVYVQAHTELNASGGVDCLEFKADAKGMIASMQYHFGLPKRAPRGGAAPAQDGAKKKARFGSLKGCKPDAQGMNLVVAVVSAEDPTDAITELKVGDSFGVVTMKCKKEEAAAWREPGTLLLLRNAHVRMFKGHIRLIVDQWGKVQKVTAEEAEEFVKGGPGEPKTANDLSATEYELKG